MARPLRIEYPGALYHITSRGDRREDIYDDDVDRESFLAVLEDCVGRFNWVVHAYCLMSNHYHLLVETPDGNLSKGMRHLNGVYTQRYNRRHDVSGHLFQGRFKAILVDKDAYLLEVMRYVVLNPVRANMVADVGDWLWSSYDATVGASPCPHWLCTDFLLSAFGKSHKTAQRQYDKFVREGVGQPSIHGQVRGQVFLGDEAFIAQAHEHVPGDVDLKEVPRQQRSGRARSLDWYVEQYQDRNTAICAAFSSGGYSMREIGKHFNLHYSMISRIVADATFKT